MPPKDTFSSSVNNIRGMLHSSIADIDALLRFNPEDETTDPNASARLAEKEADLDEALERIDRLEGQVRYFQDNDKANRKANDNLKLQHQSLKADERTRKTEWVAKEKAYKEEIARLTELLTGVNEWGGKEAWYKQKFGQLEDNIKQLQENWKDGHAKFIELEREHRRCKTSVGERVRNVNETLESQHKEAIDKLQKEIDDLQKNLKLSRDAYAKLEKEHSNYGAPASGTTIDLSGTDHEQCRFSNSVLSHNLTELREKFVKLGKEHQQCSNTAAGRVWNVHQTSNTDHEWQTATEEKKYNELQDRFAKLETAHPVCETRYAWEVGTTRRMMKDDYEQQIAHLNDLLAKSDQDLKASEAKNQDDIKKKGFFSLFPQTNTGNEEIDRLRKDLTDVQTKLAAKIAAYQVLEGKSAVPASASAVIENQRLEKQNDKLVKAIMQQMHTRSLASTDYGLIIFNIEAVFHNIQHQIDNIVPRFYYPNPRVMPLMPIGPPEELQGAGREAQRLYRSCWGQGLSHTNIMNRAKSIIFAYLFETDLALPVFELHDIPMAAELENGLRRFELLLGQEDDKEGPRTNHWRMVTMQYGRYILEKRAERKADEISSAPAYWSNKTALELKRILDMTPVNPSKVESGDAFARLVKLCDAAYKFAVIMRRSDSLMRIEMPSVGTIIDEKEHNPLHLEGDQSLPQGNTVKCAITGALVHYLVATNERRIMIKANVTI
ncbi:hypothetical protein BDZ45DRAFT_671825 [Acephala macrosclerotiorum]|nr:hypothetical protein BDZ45DRAFT_671825 [Acephala macrosclerotiorum]